MSTLIVSPAVIEAIQTEVLAPLLNQLPAELMRDFDTVVVIFDRNAVISHAKLQGRTFVITMDLEKLLKVAEGELRGAKNPHTALNVFSCIFCLLVVKAIFSYNRVAHPKLVLKKSIHEMVRSFIVRKAEEIRQNATKPRPYMV